MHTLLSLYVLASLDAMFSGICAASGRNGLIRKRRYYLRSMVFGLAWGQVACLLGLALMATLIVAGDDRVSRDLMLAGERLTPIYWAYALIVLGTFALRAFPSVDLRSLTSVVGFGPLTMLRPVVILAGLAWGLAGAPSPAVAVAACGVAILMVPLRFWLNGLLDLQAAKR